MPLLTCLRRKKQVPLLWVINVGVIAREERSLERKFGDAYRAYKARVRWWVRLDWRA
jgi:protein-S-isoprenylcysteine O-methyltransferase Ste14